MLYTEERYVSRYISDGDNYVTDFVYRILKKYPHTRRLLSYVLVKPYDDLCDEDFGILRFHFS